jgi:uncharacterized membrane protein YadS
MEKMMPDTNARKESNKFAEDCLGYISAVMLLASSIPLFIWFFLMLGSLSGGYSLPRTLGEVFLTLFSMLFVPVYLSLSLYVSISVKTKRKLMVLAPALNLPLVIFIIYSVIASGGFESYLWVCVAYLTLWSLLCLAYAWFWKTS